MTTLPPTSPDPRGTLSAGATIWVGLSGGPDSVAALRWVLAHSPADGHQVRACHCNFQLRGAESERDEQFCRTLCRRLGVPLEVRRFATRAFMAHHHLSLEVAARRLRYAWWHQLLGSDDIIVLGHHRDDSMETLLINLLRGTGIKGLTGIVGWNAATRAWRPLLGWSRADVVRYLEGLGQDYVVDSSNLEADVVRNRVRLELLPLMEQICPTARRGLATTMRHLSLTDRMAGLWADATFRRLTTRRQADGCTWYEVSAQGLRAALPPFAAPSAQRPVLTSDDTEALTYMEAPATDGPSVGQGLSGMASDEAEAPTSGAILPSIESMGGQCTVGTASDDTQEPALAFEWRRWVRQLTADPVEDHGTMLYTAPRLPDLPPVCQTSVEVPPSPDELRRADRWTAWLDADRVEMPLTWRRWQTGDRIAPLGLRGHTKLVSDLFTDAHFTPMQKRVTWIVADASGAVLWAAGLRLSDLHKVTAATRRALRLTLPPPIVTVGLP